MQNKFILKRLLPKTLVSAGILSLCVAPVMYMGVKNAIADNRTNAKLYYGVSLSTLMAATLFVIFAPFMSAYKGNQRFAARVAREYIKQISKDYPELKTFENALLDPSAVNTISALLFNSLNKSEQESVKKILAELANKDFSSQKDAFCAIENANQKICKIFAKHPESAQEVLNLVKGNNKSIYFKPQGRLR